LSGAMRKLKHFFRYWIQPIFPFRQMALALPLYIRYLQDLSRYSASPNAERLTFEDSYPILFDRTAKTQYSPHYFYQNAWAIKAILASGTGFHLDVGSLTDFVGMTAAFTKVIFVDIRPLAARLENLDVIQADILELPFASNSIPSLSCLHVAEHIGLGRYGDRLDPMGTYKAACEMVRILAPGGNLYFSVPVGRSRVCFNAHRIHSPKQVTDYFADLKLVRFSAVSDDGTYLDDLAPEELEDARYACGLFNFRKDA